MLRKQMRSRRYLFLVLVAFFAVFSYFLYGVAIGGEGTQESAHEGVQEGAHEEDRSGDLRDLLYRFINFALLVIILFVAIKKSGAMGFFSRRVEEIKEKLESLKNEKEESENRYRDIEKKLRDFEEERKDIIEQFKKEGMVEKEKIIAEAKERVQQILEQAELTIQNEMQSARDRLKQEVLDLAAQKAREILSKEITDEDQDNLVNEFIERVDKIH